MTVPTAQAILNPMGRIFSTLCLLVILGGSGLAGAQEPVAAQQPSEWAALGPQLRLADLDDLALMSEEQRAAAREQRHFAMDFLAQRVTGSCNLGYQLTSMWVRLAESYAEEARDLASDAEGSRAWTNRAIQILEPIVADDIPGFADADVAAYELGRDLEAVGRRQEAVNLYLRVVTFYAESRFVPDAYLHLGAYYSEVGNSADALLAYTYAARFEQAEQRAFALYRLAWASARVGDAEAAAAAMRDALAIPAPVDDTLGGLRLARVQAAARADLPSLAVLAQAATSPPEGSTEGRQAREAQARALCAPGPSEACVAAWQAAVAWTPSALDAPRDQVELIAGLQRLGEGDRALLASAALLRSYGPRSAWASLYATHAEHPQVLASTAAAQQALVAQLDAVTDSSDRCLETGSTIVCAAAVEASQAYLFALPDGDPSAAQRFSLAEILLQRGETEQAYELLMRNARQEPPGPMARTSARAAVLAAAAMVASERASSEAQQAHWLDGGRQRLVWALDLEIERFPDAAALDRDHYYEMAYWFHENRYDGRATQYFQHAIALDPTAPEAIVAARAALESYSDPRHLGELNTLSRAFYEMPQLGDAAFRQEIYAIYERSSYERIEQRWGRRDQRCERAEAYAAFVEEFPDGSYTEKARARAGACPQPSRRLNRGEHPGV